MFCYLWEFHVAAGKRAAFETAYGTEGDWAQLFRRHDGYLGTELLRDLDRPGVYVTIDRWVSRRDRDDFRRRCREPFEALDAACERLTESERSLGEFESGG